MANPGHDAATLKATVDAFEANGRNKAAAARALGIAVATFTSRLKAAERRGVGAATEVPLEGRERQRLRDEITALRGRLEIANRELNDSEDIRGHIFKLVEAPLAPPRWAAAPKGGPVTLMPVLFASDWQWGEVIRARHLDYPNEFNKHVAERRARLLYEKCIELCFEHGPQASYPGIVYARGGDSISGDIHEELEITNDGSTMECVKEMATVEAAGIQLLADRFGKVFVPSVPGNHGRTTRKPQSKRYVETNFDDLLSWMLEWHFRDDKRVTFYTPRSGDAVFEVFGWTFCLTHGDRIGSRGGTGFIGPVANIAKGAFKVRQQWTAKGRKIDFVMMGHWHTPMAIPGAIVNGCLPGFSEFAHELRIEPAPPSQKLFFVHPDYGIERMHDLFLENGRVDPVAAVAA